MGTMASQTDPDEEGDQDYPATHSKPATQQSGDDADENQLPCFNLVLLVHGEPP
jgi:hypothetical protein